jgi:hypothetical protein
MGESAKVDDKLLSENIVNFSKVDRGGGGIIGFYIAVSPKILILSFNFILYAIVIVLESL